jgi:hypothetical protein
MQIWNCYYSVCTTKQTENCGTSIFVFLKKFRGAASNSAYYGYPELWINGILLTDTTPCLRRDSNPRPSGWESDILRPVESPYHSAPTLRSIIMVELWTSWIQGSVGAYLANELVLITSSYSYHTLCTQISMHQKQTRSLESCLQKHLRLTRTELT